MENRLTPFTGLVVVLRLLRSHPMLSMLSLLSLLLTALAEGVSMGMIVPILSTLADDGNDNIFSNTVGNITDYIGIEYTAENLLIILLVALTTRFAMQALQMYISRRLTSTVSFELRQRSFSGVMKASLGYIQGRKTGDVVASIFTSSTQAGGAIESIFNIIIGLAFCGIYLTLNLILSVELTLTALALVGIVTVIILPRFRYSVKIGQEQKHLTDEITTFLIDKLSGMKTAKSFMLSSWFHGAFEDVSSRYRAMEVKTQINRIFTNLSLEPLISYLAIGLSVYAYSFLDMSLALIGSFFIILYRTMPQLRLVVNGWLEFVNRIEHFSHIEELIKSAPKSEPEDGATNIKQLSTAIHVDNLTFVHPKAETPALRDVSLHIPSKSFCALVGESGGGKSTLIDLILRHHRPTRGRIELDGVDLNDLRIESWRGLVSVVDQDSHLFNDTVKNNIRFGRLDASDEDIREAARLAHAAEFIEAMPNKYDTVVGDRAVRVSGGQRQRIALARALVRRPSVLILDEATSALDSESERIIQDAIFALSKKITIIAIAHRLSTVRHADNIVMFKDGQIVGQGNHDQLVVSNTLYQTYVKRQFSES